MFPVDKRFRGVLAMRGVVTVCGWRKGKPLARMATCSEMVVVDAIPRPQKPSPHTPSNIVSVENQ